MADLYIVQRQVDRASKGPAYMALAGGTVMWIEADDYDTWDEARKQATALEEPIAVLYSMMFRISYSRQRYEYTLENPR